MPSAGIEPAANALSRRCSTSELTRQDIMKHFYKLDLPKFPLKKEEYDRILQIDNIQSFEKQNFRKYTQFLTYDSDDLIQEVLDVNLYTILKDLNLIPKVLIVFYYSKDIDSNVSYIHKDLCLMDNIWKTVPFSINFEMNSTTVNTTTWWDTTGAEEFFDDTEKNRTQSKNLIAIRYHQNRLRSNIRFLNFKPFESITYSSIDNPILFRTDVAHSVITRNSQGTRFAVSLRFDLNQISTYEDAVKILQPLIKN